MQINKHFGVIFVALAMGGVATFMSYRLIQKEVAMRTGTLQENKVSVVVAAEDLDAGTALHSGILAVREIPEAYITSDSVFPESVSQIESGRLLRPLRSGEQILSSAVSRISDRSFSSTLKNGSRAMTFSVDEVNSISGLLSPEDRIDMLLVYRKGEHDVSLPLLQNVRVIATGQRLTSNTKEQGDQDNQYTNITLELNPVEARKLILAQSGGNRLTAILRNPNDVAAITESEASLKDLIRMGSRGNALRPNTTSSGITVYIGGTGDFRPSTVRMNNPSAALRHLGSMLESGTIQQQHLSSSNGTLIENVDGHNAR